MLTPKEMLEYIEQIEQGIRSRFLLATLKGLGPEATEPDFSKLGPLGIMQNLQYVLWYCEQLKAILATVRAENWGALSPWLHFWFAIGCGLAAAENMLPMDARLRGICMPSLEIALQKAA